VQKIKVVIKTVFRILDWS